MDEERSEILSHLYTKTTLGGRHRQQAGTIPAVTTEVLLTIAQYPSSPKRPPMSTSCSSSLGFSSFFFSAGAAEAAAGAPPAGAAAATGAEPMLERRSSMFCPLSALAKRDGQYGSTSFPDALITLASLSPYIYIRGELYFNDFEASNQGCISIFLNSSSTTTYSDFDFSVVEEESSISAAELVVLLL